MTNAGAPIDGLLARAGGVRGLVYTALPVTVFALVAGQAKNFYLYLPGIWMYAWASRSRSPC